MKKMIRLLDDMYYDKEELLGQMADDSFYYGFLGEKAFSSSAMKDLLKSPKTYWYKRKYGSASTQALRDGQLFHAMMLESDKVSNDFVFVNTLTKGKAYKEACQYHDNVFTKKEKEDAERLVDACFRSEHFLKYMDNSKFEVPMIGELFGYPFRGKADILQEDNIVDLKTTNDVQNFHLSAERLNYDVQCYIYCELFGYTPEKFVFL